MSDAFVQTKILKQYKKYIFKLSNTFLKTNIEHFKHSFTSLFKSIKNQKHFKRSFKLFINTFERIVPFRIYKNSKQPLTISGSPALRA